MKNFKNKLIILIVITGFLQSCSDYLDQTNPNEVSVDTYWLDLEQSDASLTGVYGGMLDTFIVNPWQESWRSDLGIVSALRTGNPNARTTPFYTHTYNSGSFNFDRQWNALYQVIFRANQVIAGLNNMDDTLKSNDRWTEQMGQARLLRGMSHFYLHAIYNNGEIIIRDKVPGTTEEFSKPTSTSAEVITFFRDDLLYAYNNLPPAFNEKSRVDRGVAATILGTSHLYEKEYGEDQALKYFNDIINNGEYGYALLTGEDVKLMYTEAGHFNSESIFEINYSVALKAEESFWYEESFSNRNARYSAPNGRGGGAPEHTVVAAWLTEAYSSEALDPLDARNTVIGYNGRDRVTDNISLRASSMVALVNDEHTAYYQSETAAIRESFNRQKISFFKQHTNHDITDHEKNVGAATWQSGKNVIVNRLADVYLMRAECYIETGKITEALRDINTIRERWGLALLGPVVDASKTYIANDPVTNSPYTDESTLRRQLRHVERPLELNIQGVSSRNIDLRRWGNAKARFAELAGMKYYLDSYTYATAEGGTKTKNRNNSLLTRTDTGKELYDNGKNEFEDAAQNYSELRDYLPIPLSETDNNTSL